MIDSVEGYLEQLKRELSGCDSATIQDALADAEEHLRTALEQASGLDTELPEEEATRTIFEKYGPPSEVAEAYREIEKITIPSLAGLKAVEPEPVLRRVFSVIIDPRAWGGLLYLFLSIITGIVYFTWAVTGISMSIGMFLLIIGLPFTVLFLLSIRSIALVEGRIVEAMLGIRMPRRSLFVSRESGWLQKVKALFLERRTWTTLIYMIMQLPLGILYFTLFSVMLSVSLSLIVSPILEFAFEESVVHFGAEAYHIQIWQMPFIVIGGFLLLISTLHLAKLIGRWHSLYAKRLLVEA